MSTYNVSRNVLAIVLVLAKCGSVCTLPAVCPPGWLAGQDACYILLPVKMNWWEASKVCDRPGSSLVVPDSQAEQDFIWREMKVQMQVVTKETNNLELWIDCTQMNDITGSFKCSGTEGDTAFRFWGDGEPNFFDHKCARMTERFGNGRWGDIACGSNKFAACEMKRVSHHTYCLSSDASGSFTPRCLLNHQIKNLTATGAIGCGQACWAEPRCHSFNILQQAGNKNKICQLNSATRFEAANGFDFKQVEGCCHFEL